MTNKPTTLIKLEGARSLLNGWRTETPDQELEVTFIKADGHETTRRIDFVFPPAPVPKEGDKPKKERAVNPDVFVFRDVEKNEIRSFNINRLVSMGGLLIEKPEPEAAE